MNVSGTGTVRIVPDIAHISIGVSSQSPDIQEALNDNNNSAATIIETLISMGVDASDIPKPKISTCIKAKAIQCIGQMLQRKNLKHTIM